ncbi:DUF3137 domain-containing protein [Haploplasma axanthum]|uniref:Protein of uncharacterized function (DUF3137) n=1 Tax=Haploplasma axanthum TaxID=29552 RepID=A0A449BF19_HAPAX|nr:DUF3137 domain-containing protein [Haploplasma axanthum]VEU81037.1 Protein of uncharacterised function (DUF3137) [Haploplasma axanthum]
MGFKVIKRKKLKYEISMIFLGVLWVIALIIGLVLGVGAAVKLEDGEFLQLVVIPPAFVSGIMYVVYRKFKKNSLKFKKIFVVNELQKIIPNITYEPELGLTRNEVYKTNLITPRVGFESEDLLKGKINNLNFVSSDLFISEKQRSKKERAGKVSFMGQFFIIDLEKTIEEPVYVLSKNNQYYKKENNYQKVELEWIKFNQQFIVYSSKDNHAFYMLTPRFMERLSKANERERKTSFAFFDDKLYVAIHTNIDTFDLRLFKPINKAFLEEIREQIFFVKEIIKTLN